MGEIRLLLSPLMERLNFARRGGVTFGGNRDLYQALGYQNEICPKDYRARYDRDDLAARIVDIYPRDTWRGGSEIVEDDNIKIVTNFEETWQELALRVKIWSIFERVDTLARLGKYAIVLIGTRGSGSLDQPMPPLKSADDIVYLTPFSDEDAMIDEQSIVGGVDDPRCGLPNFYIITRLQGRNGLSQRVHYTRVLHVADGLLDDPLRGQPCLERVWNRLDDLQKVVGAGSEAFWLRAHQGYVATFDKEVKLSDEDIEDAQQQAEEFAHQLRRTIGLQGGDFKALGSDVADFWNPVDAIVTLIAGAVGIPKRILLGSERGELASTQDRMTWERRIVDRRLEYAEPMIIRPFIDRLIENGALPKPKQYKIVWPPVDNLDDAGKAAVAFQLAGVNARMKQVAVTPDDIRVKILGWPKLEDEHPGELENPFEEKPEEEERDEVGRAANPENREEES
jgi:hypothetical protein